MEEYLDIELLSLFNLKEINDIDSLENLFFSENNEHNFVFENSDFETMFENSDFETKVETKLMVNKKNKVDTNKDIIDSNKNMQFNILKKKKIERWLDKRKRRDITIKKRKISRNISKRNVSLKKERKNGKFIKSKIEWIPITSIIEQDRQMFIKNNCSINGN